MAGNILSERSNAFNQLSNFSGSDGAFQLQELTDKLEFVASLLTKAQALSSIALTTDGLHDCTVLQRHSYLSTLDELIVAAAEQLDAVLVSLRKTTKK